MLAILSSIEANQSAIAGLEKTDSFGPAALTFCLGKSSDSPTWLSTLPCLARKSTCPGQPEDTFLELCLCYLEHYSSLLEGNKYLTSESAH